MANGYKRCPQGHFYKDDLASCPFCDTKFNAGANTQGPTQEYVGGGGNNNQTAAQNQGGDDGNRTRVMPGNGDMGNGGTIPNSGAYTQGLNRPPQGPSAPNRTVIIEDFEDSQGAVRSSRKLVGWLVSYTLNDMGVDFKLFEGRNIIGRDLDCQISVDDPSVTSKHAVLLYRAGRYSITDQQSTSGTYVNKVDIELAPRYLEDGDTIRVGKTEFKFRSSL